MDWKEKVQKDYEIISCIQQKQDKEIYQIREKNSGKLFVLKCASRSALTLLRVEADMLQEMKEPFFPEFVSYEESEESGYLIREYVEGLTLWERVETYGSMDAEEAVVHMGDICRMLEILHSLKPLVIYRDLKPQNIVLTPDGRCILIDLGTVRQYKEEAEEDTVFLGTKSTAAPEQFGYRQTDERADIYGAGMVFYCLLTGCLKLEERRLKALPYPYRRVIQRCTRFSPDERYASAYKLERAFRKLRREHRRSVCVRTIHVTVFCLLVTAFLLYKNISGPKPVDFGSALLEQAVREELGMAGKAPICEEDLASVRQLCICGNRIFHSSEDHWQYYKEHSVQGEEVDLLGGIADISVLAYMTNLQELILDGQNISDLSPLGGLPLKKLSVCNNPVYDITPLSGCLRLTDLRIEDTGVNDLSALANLQQLTVLDAGFTKVQSIEPIRGLSIEQLLLIGVHIQDFEAIADMPIERLCLYEIPEEAVNICGTISSLHELTIYHSGIEDLSALDNLHDLENLDLHSNALRSLDGVEHYPGLLRLCVGNNPVQDMNAVKSCLMLEKLEVEGTPLEDFEAVNDLKHLIYMSLSQDHEDDLLRAAPDPWFTYVFQ